MKTLKKTFIIILTIFLISIMMTNVYAEGPTPPPADPSKPTAPNLDAEATSSGKKDSSDSDSDSTSTTDSSTTDSSSGTSISSIDDVIKEMKDVSSMDTSSSDSTTGVKAVLNNVIGLLQVAGTGIAVITVTLLGVKYMLSSIEQKAEIKNRAVPIVIGCVILFGAVNLVAIVAQFANDTLVVKNK
jgi:type IV secretory pathway VirB2 component (pilin)